MASMLQQRQFKHRYPAVQALSSLLSGQLLSALAGLGLGKAIALYVPQATFGSYSLGLAAMTLGHAVLVSPVIQSLKATQAQYSWGSVLPFYKRVLLAIYGSTVAGLLVAGYVLGQVLVSSLISIAFVGQGLYAIGSEAVNLSGRFRAFAALQASYGLVNLLLFGGLVIGLKLTSVAGLWGGVALLNGLFALLTWTSLTYRTASQPAPSNPSGSATLWPSLRGYALPLLGLGIASWLSNYADRYLINYYLTPADVGVYSAGYGLGSKLLLLLGPFMSHLSSRLYKLRGDGGDARAAWHLQRRYIGLYGGLAATACLCFYGMQEWIGLLLLSEAYRMAFGIAPVVAVGYLCLTLLQLVEIKWYVYGQTRFILWHYVAGAVVNISLNILLIPRFQLMGAAVATLLSYLFQLGLVVWLYRRILQRGH